MYVSKVVWLVGLCWTLKKEATGSMKHLCLPARLYSIVFKELWRICSTHSGTWILLFWI